MRRKNRIASLILFPLVFLFPGVRYIEPLRAAEFQLFDPALSQDGRWVIVAGSVEGVSPKAGRLGSRYVEISIRTEGAEATVRVLSRLSPPCKTLLIEGVWRESGWYGGFPQERFLDARRMNCWRP